MQEITILSVLAFGNVAALVGNLWWQVKRRDKERDELVMWRTNTDRDVESLKNGMDRICRKLDKINEILASLNERVVRIETRMNGHDK